MTIKELEQKTGLARSTIRFYEQEGLFRSQRQENNYRDYSQEDVLLLQRIALLRNLGVSLEQIRELISRNISLDKVLTSQRAACEKEAASKVLEADLCTRLQRDCQSFDEIIPEKYQDLNEMPFSQDPGYSEDVPLFSVKRLFLFFIIALLLLALAVQRNRLEEERYKYQELKDQLDIKTQEQKEKIYNCMNQIRYSLDEEDRLREVLENIPDEEALPELQSIRSFVDNEFRVYLMIYLNRFHEPEAGQMKEVAQNVTFQVSEYLNEVPASSDEMKELAERDLEKIRKTLTSGINSYGGLWLTNNGNVSSKEELKEFVSLQIRYQLAMNLVKAGYAHTPEYEIGEAETETFSGCGMRFYHWIVKYSYPVMYEGNRIATIFAYAPYVSNTEDPMWESPAFLYVISEISDN